MIIVHYEVYVQESRGWMLHARFPRQEREEAIREAKELETTLNIRVKVVRETYYTDTNQFDEAEVYMSGMQVKKPAAAAAPARSASPSRSSAPSRSSKADAAPAAAPAPARRQRAPAKPTSNAGVVLGKLLIITLLGLLASFAAIKVTPDLIIFAYDYGFRITPDGYSQLMFAVFVLVFLMVAVPLAVRHLPRNPNLAISGPRFPGWRINRPSQAEREMKKSLDKLVDRAKANPLDIPEPEDEPLPVPEVEEVLPEINEHPDEPLPEIRPDEAVPELPSASADFPDQEQVNTVTMRFLGGAINAMKTVFPVLDRTNKFALNLYMAGAVETLGDVRRLDNAQRRKVLAVSLETLGTPAELAKRFHEKMEEYMLEPRYMQLIQAGRNAMDTWQSGQEAVAHQALTETIRAWNKPAEKKPQIVTVMFTDMVGSTDLTQARGDAAAQEIVRRHNSIVRTALAQFSGKEIKHTGDGIMASFPSSANAVEAAVAIQRQVAAHNAREPGQELHLRIGLNAGEPIQEEDDLFGTTVQLAARVCAATATDQILCTTVVRDLSFGKAIEFRSAGEHALKGFKERMTLVEVVWR
ncbi:MAG: adenylate/guanylate cyclase domain-containing protein [Actinomycetota bacterium]